MSTISSRYSASDYQQHSEIQTLRGSELANRVEIGPHDRLLDIGCGDGRVTMVLSDRSPNTTKILGLDISADQVRAANQRAFQLGASDKVTFAKSDFVTDPPKNQFTIAFSNAALHWMGADAYRRTFDSLTPGGRMYVEQAGYGGYRHIHDAIEKLIRDSRFAPYFANFDFYDYYYAPTESEMHTLLANTGFTDIKITAETIVPDQRVYDALSVASIHPYLDRLPAELHQQFREAFRSYCYQTLPRRDSVRLIIEGRKPE